MTVSLVKHVCSPVCDDYCFACNRHEPLPSEYYRTCAECLHSFVTEAELVDAHNKVLEGIPRSVPVTMGDQVSCCPFCIHDF